MSSDPQAFVRTVLAAFEAAGRATDDEVGRAGGPSNTTMAKYRKVAKGEMTMEEPRGDVLKRIDVAANWKQGSARALWRWQREPQPASAGSALSEALGVVSPSDLNRVVHLEGFEGYVERLAERLTEVEERLDLLEAELGRGAAHRLEVAADDADHDIEDAQEQRHDT
ncbi:hypothetical protein GCM10023340_38580 [Nocardioides marinquilinus]|uniref:Uncharacterized protein n=1 Tax=Nocardioides marinquilinus TaxID=1210400 RepID=A0ABP9Q1S7_9ACTN